MSFIYPWFLLSLAAISIPILIHLFHFRRFKKIYFSNIDFLERISDETQRQSKLKHLLVLISRILALTFLVLAFARPYIPVDPESERPEGNKVSIFVDNSFSMEAGSAYGTLLDEAMHSAREIAGLFGPTDQFQLLTNDFEAVHQRFVSKEDFLRMLNEVDFSPSVRMLSEVTQRQRELLLQDSGPENNLAFVLGDFQKNISDFAQLTPDSLVDYFLVPFEGQQTGNIFIDSVWIENPVRMSNQAITIEARIVNDSRENLDNQPIRLYINQTQRSVATFSIAPRSHTQVSLTYTVGTHPLQKGYIEITDHPVTFDDRFYFSFQLSQDIPVLAINQERENPFLNALLARDTLFRYQNSAVGAIDFSLFGSQNLIILNELNTIGSGLALELRRFVEAGGNLLVFPSQQADLESYNTFLTSLHSSGYQALDTQSTRVSSINELHRIYTGVFDHIPENINLPTVNQYFIIDRHSRSREEYLMQLQNGNHFFTSSGSGQGQVYLSAVPARDDFSNFQRHAMFVPTLYNIALHSAAFDPLYYIIGKDEHVAVRNHHAESSDLFKIKSQNIEVIPQMRNIRNQVQLMLHQQIDQHGNYHLTSSNDTLRVLSFNYDRRESLLESYSKNELHSLADNFPHQNVFVFEPGSLSFEKQMEIIRGGRQLWKIFLILGILFLFAEVLLLRFLK